uniref:Uncharacterized protein n=1 Tax=Rhizophora mucronata TaxID=61149 RepID=A0A2P2QHK1_RHIMU
MSGSESEQHLVNCLYKHPS